MGAIARGEAVRKIDVKLYESMRHKSIEMIVKEFSASDIETAAKVAWFFYHYAGSENEQYRQILKKEAKTFLRAMNLKFIASRDN